MSRPTVPAPAYVEPEPEPARYRPGDDDDGARLRRALIAASSRRTRQTTAVPAQSPVLDSEGLRRLDGSAVARWACGHLGDWPSPQWQRVHGIACPECGRAGVIGAVSPAELTGR